MKKILFLVVAFTAILMMGCSDSSGSDDNRGSFSVEGYTDQPLILATYYFYDDEGITRCELTLFGNSSSDSLNSVNFNLDIADLPETETTYTFATGLNFCEVEADYNDDEMTGYAAEMDYNNDTESWVTIRKSRDTYTIEFSVQVSESDSFVEFDHLTGSYTGPIEDIEDYIH